MGTAIMMLGRKREGGGGGKMLLSSPLPLWERVPSERQ
jgi:hypothetical protein